MVAPHRNLSAAFYFWNDVWPIPEFNAWNIEGLLPGIDAPVLLIQGEDDSYGGPAQAESVAAWVIGPVEREVLSHRHVPRVQAAQETLAAVPRFVAVRGSKPRMAVR